MDPIQSEEGVIAWIALGSNLGNRKQWILRSIEMLSQEKGISLLKISSLLETRPQGNQDQEPFLNGVVQIQTIHPAPDLWKILQKIENLLERKRTVFQGPRTVDLDLLFYGKEILHSLELTLPHPRIQERYFVLKPLLELEPDLEHPVYRKTIQELWQEFLKSGPKEEGWEI